MQKQQYTSTGTTTDWNVGVLKDPAGNHNAYVSYAYDGDTCYVWHKYSAADSSMRIGVKETKNGAFIGSVNSSLCNVTTSSSGGQYYIGKPYSAKSSSIETEFSDLAEWVITGLNNRSNIVIYYGYTGTTYYYDKGINSPKKTTYGWKSMP